MIEPQFGILELLERLAYYIPAPEGPALAIGMKIARAWMKGRITDSDVIELLKHKS